MALSSSAQGRAGGGGCTTRPKPFQRAFSAGRLRTILAPTSPSSPSSGARNVSPSMGRTVQATTERVLDVSKINGELHDSQRFDTFHTPSRLRASEYTELFRQDILDAVREELHGGFKWLREDMFQGCRDAMSMATADIKEEIRTLTDRLDADFSLVLGEMWKLHPCRDDIGGDQVDRSPTDASSAATAFRRESSMGSAFEELQRLIHEAMTSIAGYRNQLDVQLQEVRGITPRFSEVLVAIENTRSQVDLQPLIDEFKRAQTCAPQRQPAAVDLQPLLEELRGFKAEMDFSLILGSIEMSQAELKAAIEKTRSQVDLQLLIDEFKGVQTYAPQRKAAAVDLQPLLEELRRFKAEMDFSPVLSSIVKSQFELHSTLHPIIEEIRSKKATEDRQPLIDELRTSACSKVEVDHRHYAVEEIRSTQQPTVWPHSHRPWYA